jgi:hypothetical protein
MTTSAQDDRDRDAFYSTTTSSTVSKIYDPTNKRHKTKKSTTRSCINEASFSRKSSGCESPPSIIWIQKRQGARFRTSARLYNDTKDTYIACCSSSTQAVAGGEESRIMAITTTQHVASMDSSSQPAPHLIPSVIWIMSTISSSRLASGDAAAATRRPNKRQRLNPPNSCPSMHNTSSFAGQPHQQQQQQQQQPKEGRTTPEQLRTELLLLLETNNQALTLHIQHRVRASYGGGNGQQQQQQQEQQQRAKKLLYLGMLKRNNRALTFAIQRQQQSSSPTYSARSNDSHDNMIRQATRNQHRADCNTKSKAATAA